MPDHRRRKTLFFIDPIEASSYPVTETGYGMLYRAWARAEQDGGEVYAVYPNAELHSLSGRGSPGYAVDAHRIEYFAASPYEHFKSQRRSYDAGSDVGSQPCHRQSSARAIELTDADVIVFRQETGPVSMRRQMLKALAAIEDRVLVYLSPTLALDPRYSSKVLPAQIAPERVPLSFETQAVKGDIAAKVEQAMRFVQGELRAPPTFIAKPIFGDNGIGITACGRSPIEGGRDVDAHGAVTHLLQTHGDLIIQEYIPSIRAPADIAAGDLHQVSEDRRDFGEIRFLLIDGTIPRTRDGRRIQVARRVPTASSLVADSGISYGTTLSREECDFLAQVGREYLRRNIYFGGGDLIRTPHPNRPFVFTDAARSVCGHAVVTGALNGEPYLIVDQVLDSIERQLIRRTASSTVERVALPA